MIAQADWGWLTNQGLAVGLLVAIGVGAWRICSWAGTNVVIPMKDACINHLHETNTAMKSNAEATGALSQTLSNLHGNVDVLHSDVKEIKTKLGMGCKFHQDHTN